MMRRAPLLAALAAALAAIAAPVILVARASPVAEPRTALLAGRLTGNRALAPAVAPALDAALARPLFADGTPGAATGSPELIGVAGRIGKDAVAIVRDADGHSSSLVVGASEDGWRLDAIGSDAVLFSKGTMRRRVELPGEEGGAPDQ